MTRAVIVTSYLEFPVDLPGLLQPDDYIVCLDRGFEIAQRQGIRPDLLLGDFDSIQSQKLVQQAEALGVRILRYPPEKDYTDLEIAFRVLDPQTTPDLLVIGGLGGRLDQTLINIQMLQRYTGLAAGIRAGAGSCPADHSLADHSSADHSSACPDYGSHRLYRHIELMDGHSRCFVVCGEADAASDEPRIHAIPRVGHSFLSLLSLTEECSGIRLQGVKYPLKDAVLMRGASLSVSNEFLSDTATLRVGHGQLLVVITQGNENDF